jgi:hypothetical protein
LSIRPWTPQEGSRRHQEATGNLRKPREPQKAPAPGSPKEQQKFPEEAPGSARKAQKLPRGFKTPGRSGKFPGSSRRPSRSFRRLLKAPEGSRRFQGAPKSFQKSPINPHFQGKTKKNCSTRRRAAEEPAKRLTKLGG